MVILALTSPHAISLVPASTTWLGSTRHRPHRPQARLHSGNGVEIEASTNSTRSAHTVQHKLVAETWTAEDEAACAQALRDMHDAGYDVLEVMWDMLDFDDDGY